MIEGRKIYLKYGHCSMSPTSRGTWTVIARYWLGRYGKVNWKRKTWTKLTYAEALVLHEVGWDWIQEEISK